MTGVVAAVLAAAEDPDLSDAFGDRLTTRDWVAAGVILVVAIVVGRVLQTVVQRVMSRDDDSDVAITHFAATTIRNLVILGGIVYALGVLDVRLGPLLGAIGIGGLAIAFAAQSILAAFFASIILRTRRPFRRGDQVVLGDVEGTVEEVNFRTVSVRTFDGERALVPCDVVLGDTITNLTARGRRRTTFEVQVSYETDLVAAIGVLEPALARVEGVLDRPEPRAYVKEMADSGITLSLLVWHAPEMMTMWQVRSDVGVAAHVALVDAGIEIPFPQRVVRFRTDEEAREDEPDVGDGRGTGARRRPGTDPNRDTREADDGGADGDGDGGD